LPSFLSRVAVALAAVGLAVVLLAGCDRTIEDDASVFSELLP
jgi:outer membrane murein-binding lipoprotein Lpp